MSKNNNIHRSVSEKTGTVLKTSAEIENYNSEDGQTSTTYELFSYLCSYLKMFTIRVCKDLYQTILYSYYSERGVLPAHIVDLMTVHKKLHLEQESKRTLQTELSENSLDVHIPSYPGSPRSLNIGSTASLESNISVDLYFKDAVNFLHEDKELLIAAETGNDKMIEILIRKRSNLQQIDHIGRNALHFAVCSANERAIKLLLDAGVNVNVKDNVGMTPLSLCLMRRPSHRIANLLFDHGAKIVPRSNPMDTGLFLQFVMMCSPTDEEEKILRLLVQKGAIINDPEAPGGRQALHFAAMSNNCQLINILVDLGADLHSTNHRNQTPKEVAMTFKCKQAFNLLSQLEQLDNCSNISLFRVGS